MKCVILIRTLDLLEHDEKQTAVVQEIDNTVSANFKTFYSKYLSLGSRTKHFRLEAEEQDQVSQHDPSPFRTT